MNGKGVPQNYQEALRLFRKAADNGSALAQAKVGFLYADGKGIPQDYSEAVKWYRRAAERGESSGQYFLGMSYFEGKGVAQDYVSAHLWLNLSAAGSSDDIARKLRDEVAAKMTPDQIGEAQRLARQWRPEKAEPKK
jgi:TPR repeat protein